MEMASSMPNFSYRRLKNEAEAKDEKAIFFKRTRKRLRRFEIRKRPKLRIPGLRRFLRKRSRLLSRIKVSWGKTLKRLKKGHVHMNDLFGGNFLVLQHNITPFSSGSGKKAYRDPAPARNINNYYYTL